MKPKSDAIHIPDGQDLRYIQAARPKSRIMIPGPDVIKYEVPIRRQFPPKDYSAASEDITNRIHGGFTIPVTKNLNDVDWSRYVNRCDFLFYIDTLLVISLAKDGSATTVIFVAFDLAQYVWTHPLDRNGLSTFTCDPTIFFKVQACDSVSNLEDFLCQLKL